MNNEILVSTQWLKQNLSHPDLVILDSSLLKTVSEVKETLEQESIPNARYFDIKQQFSDPSGRFPNTFPSEKQFESACQNLGINQISKIVIYDRRGIYSSPRAWFMFRTMGHQEVYVLDGGLLEWKRLGFKTEIRSVKEWGSGDFKASLKIDKIKGYQDILANISSKNSLVIDARSSGRFDGKVTEPRKYLKSGHIPNSINSPYTEVLRDGKFKPKEELAKIFEEVVDKDQNLIFSCGSGITACIVMLACELVMKNQTSLYDGSWTEWAELQGLKR